MAKTDFSSVDEYIASHPPDVQAVLRRVRAILRKALPRAEEVISYQIPAYRLDGVSVLFFAGWKEHFSLYPATEPLVAEFRAELLPYKLSKGTIRFPLAEPVPARLIERIARFKAKEEPGRAQARAAAEGKGVVKRAAGKKAAGKKAAAKKAAAKKSARKRR